MILKKPFLMMALLGIYVIATAQYNFVVQNGNSSAYSTLDDAYANAVDGDTIYLPGGSFNIPSVDKKLAWIGVGYHPDSTESTYITRINNQAAFSGKCDNTFITGILFASDVNIGSDADDALDFIISRCRINGSVSLKFNDGISRNINAKMSECIIDGNLMANLGSNIIIEKCIVRGTLNDFRNSYFERIILSFGSYSYYSSASFGFGNTQYCQIRNSIINYNRYFSWTMDINNCTNNSFSNNIFIGSVSFPNGTNTGMNNKIAVPLVSLFDSIDGSLPDYSYNHDFHLKEGSPALGAGTSGSDIGIYGGPAPFKTGGLPFNPHIRTLTVGDETSNGLLPVKISVGAQNK